MYRVCIPEPFYNCDKIYPIQQKKVKQLLDILLKNNNVLEVVIFGSSVTDSCHVGSDVDIYVKLIRNQKNLIDDVIYFRYDLWTNFTVDERLLKEIKKNGVIVYNGK